MKFFTFVREKIKANRRQLEIDLLASPQRRYFSPIYYGQYEITVPLMERYLRGHLLDLGCGDLPFKELILPQVQSYDTLDFFPRRTDLTYVSDLQNMSIVPDNKYDTAICLEVLEHIPNPSQALQEIHRILIPEGTLVLSVPHLSRLHEEPHDYFRYTHYGLTHLLQQAGFEVITLEHRGGLLTFLGHQISTTLLGITWTIPLVQQIAWFINRWCITQFCYQLDTILQANIFAAGYTVVARKI